MDYFIKNTYFIKFTQHVLVIIIYIKKNPYFTLNVIKYNISYFNIT